jgi:hypothetical protein
VAAGAAALAAAVPALAVQGAPATIETVARIPHPRGLAIAPDGSVIVAEPFVDAVGRISPDGTVSTVVGIGSAGMDRSQGAAAGETTLDLPHGVAFTADGALLIADALDHRILRLDQSGAITTVAGTGRDGYSGDGGPAVAAEIDSPRGIAALPEGGFLFPDTDNERIRRVWPDGTITTVAGDGVKGFGGDGGPATSAELDQPFSVAPLPGGGFLIADASNERIRRVWPDGTITTVAGDGRATYGGDGGPATAASLNTPHAVVAAPDGGYLVADTYDNRIRRVTPDGVIETVAGTGEAGFSGDGGPADAAELDLPKALAVLPDGTGFLVADSANDRVRLVTLDLRPPFTLALAARSLRTRAGHPFVLHLTLSLPASVRLAVTAGSRVVSSVDVHRGAGRGSLVYGRKLWPGRYRVTVEATSADGRAATEAASLAVNGSKP